ncbi:putative T7SS-secreted protein [Streptomyces lydicus]
MSDDWSGLGWNPTPGHPPLATDLADNLKKTAETLKSTYDLLDSLDKESSYWTGEAATAFTEKVSDLPDYLQRAHDSLKSAGGELAKWSDALYDMKVKANNYEEDAKSARKHAEEAERRYGTARSHPDFKLAGQTFETKSELENAQHRIDAAQDRVDAASKSLDHASNKLQNLIDDAKKLEIHHADTAQDFADQIRKHASDHAPGGGFWDTVGDWWDEHGGDLLTIAATAAGIAAIFVPVLAPLAIGLSLAAAATHANQYIKSGKDMFPRRRRTSANGQPSAETCSVPSPASARPSREPRPPSAPDASASGQRAGPAQRPRPPQPSRRRRKPVPFTSRNGPRPWTRRTVSSRPRLNGRQGSSARRRLPQVWLPT